MTSQPFKSNKAPLGDCRAGSHYGGHGLRHLRHFVAVAEELHFARAAERLGIEQSPLSHSIRNLEAELQVALLHRTTRRTWLTRAGARFYADAKRILGEVEAAAASLRSAGTEGPETVRLALGEDLAGESFTRLLFELEHHQPPARVEVREMTHAEAAHALREGAVDVALTLDGRREDGLVRRRGWGEPVMLVLPFDHPMAHRDSVSLRDLSGERLALPSSTTCPGYLMQVEALFTRHETQFADRLAVRHWNTAVSFAAAGRSVALCPASFVAGATSVAIVPLSETDAELVTWLLHPEADLSPAATLVLDITAAIAAGEAPANPVG